MKSKIVTKFKNLNRIFKKDEVGYDPNNPRVLYKTYDLADYKSKRLEKQQTKWFQNQWQKVKTSIQNKALVYETQRYPSYIDYDLMELYPIIGQALDIIMEESTTTNEKGKILNITSESKRVKEVLEELFYNRLNIHTNLPMWIRNMCKYGDNFVFLQIDDENGIYGAKQMPNIEVERIEGNVSNRMRSYLESDEEEVVFRWKSTDLAEFKYYQVAHFRLLADDRKLPYGCSILEKSRRVWKNLLLVEDAMRTIRLLRAIDRRAYYVNVGNLDPKDIKPFVDDVASRFKRQRHVDPQTGQEDLKYNVIGYDQDFIIPIRDKDDGTRIETIQGASNLDQTTDIEYDLALLFASLGVPKPFLQYEDVAGEGKNLAMQDIRFARKINRIQQAALQELNKIALIHLYLVGLEDDMNNFELTLNNPSTQADILRTELMASKISVFKDAVSDANGHGIAAMSITMAMKQILGMTDNEIKLNLEQQYLERAAGFELENAPDNISDTTLFDRVLKLYGDSSLGVTSKSTDEDSETSDGGGGFSGGGLGGNIGGDTNLDLGEESDEFSESENEAGIDDELSPEEDNEIDDALGDAFGEAVARHKQDKLLLNYRAHQIKDLIGQVEKL